MSDQADYMREYRRSASGQRATEKQNARTTARRRALVRLSEMYPDDFRNLFQEELAVMKGERGLRD